MSANVTESLRRARRSLDDLFPQISVEDWLWDDLIGEWCLAFSARVERPDKVPGITRWVLTASSDYPNCRVKIYPAADGGIGDTHPHQANNGLERYGEYCRSGDVCLFTEGAEWARRGHADFTVLAHVERFLEWLECANEGTLMKIGDHVEFPMQSTAHGEIVFYHEDDASKAVWDRHPTIRSGMLKTVQNRFGQTCLFSFHDSNRKPVYSAIWGTAFDEDRAEKTDWGIWLIAPSVPHVRCWQSPNTYGELREWAKGEGIDLDGVIARNASSLRDGVRHFLAIGVTCPDVVGGELQSLSWFIAKMPRLADEGEFAGGGVHNRRVLKTVDRQKHFMSSARIDWAISVNCSKEQVCSRGGLCDELSSSRIAIIGMGSLGSLVADCLVRGGATDLCIFDSDKFEAGNVSRHLLRFCDVGTGKAAAVAAALSMTSPIAKVDYKGRIEKGNATALKEFDVVIDCSSSPSVLSILDSLEGGQRLFVCSFGYAAERVYIYASSVGSFSFEGYQNAFGELLKEDAKRIEEKGLPWEGIGCWSPVFPAKHSDVSRAASLVADCINRTVERKKLRASYAYVTKRDGCGFLLGIERIEL